MQIGKVQLKNRYFLAPLASISNLPFRLINKEFGCALVYTEMISAQGLIRKGAKTLELLKSDEKEKPVSYQIFGGEPDALAKAAKICEDYGADIVDINMGCPVKKVVKSNSGSALLADAKRVEAILKSVRKAIAVPLTIKLRIGIDSKNITYLEIAKIAEAEGVDAICLHPRTKNQGFSGNVDLQTLKRLKEAVRIPIIGSGNLFSVDDVKNMFEQTNCDAVMIARGVLGNPFIFKELIDTLDNKIEYIPPTKLQVKTALLKHIECFLQYFPPALCNKEMKKHLLWHTKGFEGSSAFRKEAVSIKSVDEMRALIEEFFGN